MVDSPSDATATERGHLVGSEAVGDGGPGARGPTRRSRRSIVARVVLGAAALCVLYVGFTFWQVWHAARTDVRRPSDAIVVLGAAQYDGRPSPVLQARLDTAFELYLRGLAPLVVTTGANQAGDRHTEAESGYEYLRDRGVPESALLAIPIGTNTWEELEATADELAARGGSRVLLVSDPYHAYRVDHVADEVGLDGAVVSTPGAAPLDRLVRETAGATIGRFVGYEALSKLG